MHGIEVQLRDCVQVEPHEVIKLVLLRGLQGQEDRSELSFLQLLLLLNDHLEGILVRHSFFGALLRDGRPIC